ncbi:MAG: heavy metal translocating P-type ATPase [Neisseriaceae bacterium]
MSERHDKHIPHGHDHDHDHDEHGHCQTPASPNAGNASAHDDSKKTYFVEGMTCAHCAGQFEDNLKKLGNVSHATVNFAASKVTVSGSVSLADITKAGAFESLVVHPEGEQPRVFEHKPFWRQPENIKVVIAAVVLLITYVLSKNEAVPEFWVTLGYAATMLIGGLSLFRQGLQNLSKFIFDINTLITVAILGAAIIGEWLEGATVVILFAISEALEAYSMNKARKSIQSLMDIAPNEALVKQGGDWVSTPVEAIGIGDVLLIKPGQKIAMDGVISLGLSTINQAPITGESMPVNKTVGDEVFAGTLNEEGVLEVTVSKAAKDSTLAKIISLVEEAQAQKAPAQQFVDKFARYYTPIIMIIAALIAVVPPLFFGGEWHKWIYQGLAVLVVGCPCALVISTPIAIVTAIGNAAKQGILIKGGIHLEEAGTLKAIAFDKTGTLTEGKPEVTDFIFTGAAPEADTLAIAHDMEQNSQHPLSQAIVRYALQTEGLTQTNISHFQSITGKGIQADIDGITHYIGNPSLFLDNLQQSWSDTLSAQVDALLQEQKTVMIMGTQTAVTAIIAVRDKLRASAPAVLKALHQQGLTTIMLTGDNAQTAAKVASQVGIDEVHANLLPEDKLTKMKALLAKHGKVAMVGDGVNDAPALAAATLGIAMGQAGTDTALETANIAFMKDDLDQLPYTIRLSRKAVRIIKENISFSLIVKLIALLLVIPGWLTLWIAVFADMGATLLVTLNSLRLLRLRDK